MIKIGDVVKLKNCDLTGKICSINNEECVVDINNKKITTKLDNIEKTIKENSNAKKEKDFSVNLISKNEKIEFIPEIMVRHQTVEEALFNVDVFIKEAVYNEAQEVKIIHGKNRWSFKEIYSRIPSFKPLCKRF